MLAAVHVVGRSTKNLLAKAPYTMATSDAERIGVNAAASIAPGGAVGSSGLAHQYTSLHSALKMLSERVQIIHKFCQDMQASSVPLNHQVRGCKVLHHFHAFRTSLNLRCVGDNPFAFLLTAQAFGRYLRIQTCQLVCWTRDFHSLSGACSDVVERILYGHTEI
jgi:hypothetical protein